MENSRTERRIRSSSLMIAAGLLVQLGTLATIHPLAFVGFLMIGCPLVVGGIALYLLSLI